VEAAWRVVDDVLDRHGPAHLYAPGTWGPPEADAIVDDPHGWHDPGP
jgi:glucose-6-phosphate 1-dehydrogenase